MGLLSDPEYGSVKWVKVLKKVHTPLCVLCYFAAIAWFLGLGHTDFNNETYFSENALLPGLVTNEFNAEQSAKQIHSELLQELNDKYKDNGEMPISWLVAKMSQLHLEVYTHNFTLNSPLIKGQVYTGTNVYGILRAARSSSLEALVISVPYRSLSSHLKGTTAGIALMLSFAQFARPQKYWAKDIIFLVTEHEQLGMQAWLEAYHGLQSEAETFYKSLASFWEPGTSIFDLGSMWGSFYGSIDHTKYLNPGELKGRSGSIQAAINLEFHTPKIKYIEVKVEGLNGQLPNLDLVNLMHKLCDKYGVHHSYQKSYSWMHTRNKMEKWKTSVLTMLGMFTTQLSGVPNGNHGLFHRFGIEAVTLEGREANDPAGDPPRVNALAYTSFYRLGVVLESSMRSLNNLLERFHQSYFFYILAGTERFISIGQYMPCIVLLSVSLLIRALAMWISMPIDEEEQDEKAETIPVKIKTVDFSLVHVGANYLIVHLLGYCMVNTPMTINNNVAFDQTPVQMVVYFGLGVVSIVISVLALLIHRQLRCGPISYKEFAFVYILILVELATACLCIGMHNYYLGLLAACAYVPLALMVGVFNRKTGAFLRVFKCIVCILLHPISIITISLIAYTYFSGYDSDMDMWAAAKSGLQSSMKAITYAVTDCMIYGNWVFTAVSFTFVPIWLLIWQTLCADIVYES